MQRNHRHFPAQRARRATGRRARNLAGFLVLGWVLSASPAVAQETPPLPALTSPPSGERIPGKFVWFDLATPNLGEAQSFYQDVFGWTYRSPGVSADDYVLVLNGGQPISGMFQAEPAGGEQDGATWLALMSVDNVDQAVATARAAGATVEVEPADVPARGRHALLRDPGDAIFGVLRSSSGDPRDAEVPLGGILWVDLFARDIVAMEAFYGQLAPFTMESRQIVDSGEGRVLNAGGMPRAGLVPVDEEANRSAWVPYVRVADVQATLDKAEDGGGFVIVAPDPAVLDGNLGIFVDPNGGVTGVVRWDYDGAAKP